MLKGNLGVLVVLAGLACMTWRAVCDEKLCAGNRFLFLSTYVLGLQEDLNKTLTNISKTAEIEQVEYQDQLYRSYKIENITQTMAYSDQKQKATLMGKNILRITGGTVLITFKFDWVKTQLGSFLAGKGNGTVSSDAITYEKTLRTNSQHQLQWNLTFSSPLSITNGLSLKFMDPYRAADYEILSNMLNKLKNNQTTVKDNLLKVINANFQSILAEVVLADPTLKFDPNILYSYSDYRGLFYLNYSQKLMNSTLAENGLYLIFSQVINEDDQFECGPPVPQVPSDTSVFGGLQEFLSNSLLKSTLKFALKQGFLDVVLTQEFWQSRAFQFFIGDVHEVMPNSTKKISTMQVLKGGCKGINDPVFSFAYKSVTAYQVKVNFECQLAFNESKPTRLITIDVVATYEVAPRLSSKTLDFVLNSISGKPSFVQSQNFKVEYKELAEFMVGETMALARGGKVIGSDYQMDKAVYRKFPQVMVKPDYLFMYDSTAKPKAPHTH